MKEGSSFQAFACVSVVLAFLLSTIAIIRCEKNAGELLFIRERIQELEGQLSKILPFPDNLHTSGKWF